MKKITSTIMAALIVLSTFLAIAGSALGGVAQATNDEPIVVTEPDGIHDCDDTWTETETRTGVRTEERTRTIPGEAEVSHQEYRYSRTVEGEYHEEQSHLIYEVAKFTRERTRTYTPGTEGQHYSLKGNSGIGKHDIPVWPAWYWQANTHQEPHGTNSATWPNGQPGLHYTSGGQGKRDWFYYVPGTSASYGEWSPWSTPTQWYANLNQDPHHEWVETVPSPNWQQHGGSYTNTYQRDWAVLPTGKTEKVVDQEAYTDPDVTYFYVNGGSETTVEDSSNESDQWTADEVDTQVWTQIDEREVVDKEAVPERTETYEVEVEYEYEVEVEYEAGWECPPETTEPPTTTEPPQTTVPPTTTPEVPTTTEPPVVTTVPDAGTPDLPSTGSTPGTLAAIAAVVLGVGVLTTLGSRRRKA